MVPPPGQPEVVAAVLAARRRTVRQPHGPARLLAHLHVGAGAAAAGAGGGGRARRRRVAGGQGRRAVLHVQGRSRFP